MRVADNDYRVTQSLKMLPFSNVYITCCQRRVAYVFRAISKTLTRTSTYELA